MVAVNENELYDVNGGKPDHAGIGAGGTGASGGGWGPLPMSRPLSWSVPRSSPKPVGVAPSAGKSPSGGNLAVIRDAGSMVADAMTTSQPVKSRYQRRGLGCESEF